MIGIYGEASAECGYVIVKSKLFCEPVSEYPTIARRLPDDVLGNPWVLSLSSSTTLLVCDSAFYIFNHYLCWWPAFSQGEMYMSLRNKYLDDKSMMMTYLGLWTWYHIDWGRQTFDQAQPQGSLEDICFRLVTITVGRRVFIQIISCCFKTTFV